MKYHVELETQAKREFGKLTRSVQEALASVIDDLSVNPRPPACKKLSGQNAYRVRKGDYRILYVIEDKAKRIRLYRIGHRRDVYR